MPTLNLDYIPINSDTLLRVDDLFDPVNGTYYNGATINVTILNMVGVPVVGQTWPLVLQYITGSDGDYHGVLEDGLELIDGGIYEIRITTNVGADLVALWREVLPARYRHFNE